MIKTEVQTFDQDYRVYQEYIINHHVEFQIDRTILTCIKQLFHVKMYVKNKK